MCVSNKFDSDRDFKGKAGDEDEVVGKIQNDATSAFAFAVNYWRFFFEHFDVCQNHIWFWQGF